MFITIVYNSSKPNQRAVVPGADTPEELEEKLLAVGGNGFLKVTDATSGGVIFVNCGNTETITPST